MCIVHRNHHLAQNAHDKCTDCPNGHWTAGVAGQTACILIPTPYPCCRCYLCIRDVLERGVYLGSTSVLCVTKALTSRTGALFPMGGHVSVLQKPRLRIQ
jgi:hypothetical protein